MPEQLFFTKFLNGILAGPAAALLHVFGLVPKYPEAPITNFVAMEILVFLMLVAFFALVRARLSVDSPGAMQHLVETSHEFVENQSHEIIGHHTAPYIPFLMTLGFFILLSNLIGLIPGFESPTSNPAVPLGCALVAWFYYQVQGIRHAGLAYFKHFLGPVWWLTPLMLPIEIISHLARAMSLTIRLYANIYAGDMVTLVFFSLVPIALPVVFLGLHVGVSFLQTYIFVLLTMVYISGAVAEAH